LKTTLDQTETRPIPPIRVVGVDVHAVVAVVVIDLLKWLVTGRHYYIEFQQLPFALPQVLCILR
jgi:hypothetical protein